MQDFNYWRLREGDIVLTTSRSFLASGIKARTVSWNPLKFLSMKYANHAGIIYSMVKSNGEKRFYMAEMLTTLKSTPLLAYLNNGFWGDRIVKIRRNLIYDDICKRMAVNDRIMDDLTQIVKYDYKGILEYLWPKATDKPDRFYCSEYVQRHMILDGMPIDNPTLDKNDQDDISPYAIQMAENLVDVTGWLK